MKGMMCPASIWLWVWRPLLLRTHDRLSSYGVWSVNTHTTTGCQARVQGLFHYSMTDFSIFLQSPKLLCHIYVALLWCKQEQFQQNLCDLSFWEFNHSFPLLPNVISATQSKSCMHFQKKWSCQKKESSKNNEKSLELFLFGSVKRTQGSTHGGAVGGGQGNLWYMGWRPRFLSSF